MKRWNQEEEKIPGKGFQREEAENSNAQAMKIEINKTGTAHLCGKEMKNAAG